MMLLRCLKIAACCVALTTFAACGKDDPPAEQPDIQSDMQPDAMSPDDMPTDDMSMDDMPMDDMPTDAPDLPPPPPMDEEPDEVEEFVNEVQKGLMLAMVLKAAIEDTYDTRGELPQSVDDLGTAARTVPNVGDGVESLTVEDGVIVIDYASRGTLPGGTIEMTPTPGSDGIDWDCSGGTLAADYRPDECR